MRTRALIQRFKLILCGVSLGAALGTFSIPAMAAQVTETGGRMEINWSTLRIRFFGEAPSGPEGLKSAERKAWQEGLNYIGDAVHDLNVAANEHQVSNTEKLAEDARAAAKQVAASTFSYNTTYFANGSVRVHLESGLPKALESSGVRFRQKEAAEPAMIQHTGIVIDADKPMKPSATYQVVDRSGTVLFDVRDMAADGYRKNLMGRWFKRPGPGELSEAIGKRPLRLKAVVEGDRFVVDRQVWEEAVDGYKSLLVNGLIAISLP